MLFSCQCPKNVLNPGFGGSLPAALPLPLVLSLRVGNGLPLHIAWRISPVAGKWNDVIYDIALAMTFACTSSGAWVLLFELNLGALAAFDTGIGNLAGRRQHHGD